MQSIFSTYSQGENRVTSTIIGVLKHLPVNVVERFLSMFSEKDNQTFILFRDQAKGENSTPDAEISASFKLLFETKATKNAVDRDQLKRHNDSAKESAAILVYLTPDAKRPVPLNDVKYNKVVWKNFQDVYDLIDELIGDKELVLSERDLFLLRNLQVFFRDSGLLPKTDEVVIIAAKEAWPIYEEFGLYACQPGRSFRDVDRLGFYCNGEVKEHIPKIYGKIGQFTFPNEGSQIIGQLEKYSGPVSSKANDFAKKLEKWLEQKPELKGKTFQIFDLSLKDNLDDTETLVNPIKNNLTSKKDEGRATAFTQGQRYVELSKLKKAKNTTDLK